MPRAAALIVAVCLGLISLRSEAATSGEDIPDALRPWIPWVLHGQEEFFCPALYNSAESRVCAWPARLTLVLDDRGGSFEQTWRVYKDSWVPLPGSANRWPSDVQIAGRQAIVSDRNGTPSVFLRPGAHSVNGAFTWQRLPKSLRIPEETGLIDLTVDGKTEGFPNLDEKGNLWLRDRTPRGGKDEQDHLALKVFRHLADDLPMRVSTRIQLDVSGEHREVILGGGLLDGFIPLALATKLPARLEPGGQLRVQIRPGQWVMTLVARHPGPVDRLVAPTADAPWPAEEIWVFDAHNDLRLVEIEGVRTIDPTQAALPAKWRQLPTFGVGGGDTLKIVTKRRGDPEPAPDQLSLARTLWLDFDGRGYTVRDAIQGSMRAGWRLEMNSPFQLGRVAVDGQDRFITQAEGSDKAGVELRRGAVRLVADSRLEGGAESLNAVGWDHDFRALETVLHLPPGWRLASAGGADRVSSTWLQQWTMLDLFLVLVIALAVARLWSWPWGAIALVMLVVIYHEPDAPRWVWLNVLAPVALLRAMPSGRLHKAVGWYRDVALLALVLMVLPFVISEVRNGLYPQLERPWQSLTQRTVAPFAQISGRLSDQAAVDALKSDDRARAAEKQALLKLGSRASGYRYAPSSALDQYDPRAKVTTGPGLPRWAWTTVRLRWNGPVERGQMLHLTLIPPWINLVLSFAGVVLIGMLTVLLMSTRFKIKLPLAGKAAAAGVLLAMVVAQPGPARAESPDPALLDALRERLLEIPECFPYCAQSPMLTLEIEGERMLVRVAVHAAEAVAVPLPGDDRFWHLQRIEIDGRPVDALRRDSANTLWVYVPKGRHVIVMQGALANAATVPLPLPLKPRRVMVRAEGWRVEGVDEEGVPAAQLQLARLPDPSAAPAPTLEPARLPPFVHVERILILGLEWRVQTSVTRDAVSRGAVVVNVPTLEGESVITAGINVEAGEVQVNMTPKQRKVVWTSTLEKRDVLELAAARTTAWTEAWQLDASPIWRVRGDGLAPVFHQDPNGRWRPVWRPWPGEQLTLRVSRPTGVEGQTLTVDRSQLRVRPGQRSTDVKLTLDLRSSQGDQHTLRLPEGVRLDSVTIDGRLQPMQPLGRDLTLPITPGKHAIVLDWHESRAIASRFTTSPVDLAVPSVNSEIVVSLPRDRWVLLTSGPTLGPAVLFWGVLMVVVAIAIGLGRTSLTTLRTHEWLLLGVGLTQAPIPIGILVVAWLLALGARRRFPEDTDKTLFNLTQVGLPILTAMALAGLFYAVEQGLLGMPEMQVVGNRSSAYALNWYQDRAGGALPEATVISVSIWFYRLAMLGWALWLALALLRWLRWGWECYSSGGIWRTFRLRRPRRRDGADAEPASAES